MLAVPAALAAPAAPPSPAAQGAQCAVVPGSARAVSSANGHGSGLWQKAGETPAPARPDAKPAVNPRRYQPYKLNKGGMHALLATAPNEHGRSVRQDGLVLSLPNPCGAYERFGIEESPIMEAWACGETSGDQDLPRHGCR